jgi:hypothetical protein
VLQLLTQNYSHRVTGISGTLLCVLHSFHDWGCKNPAPTLAIQQSDKEESTENVLGHCQPYGIYTFKARDKKSLGNVLSKTNLQKKISNRNQSIRLFH